MAKNSSPVRHRERTMIWLGLAFALVALVLASPIQNQIQRCLVLHSETANGDLIRSLIRHDRDPATLIRNLWRTRKIPQRQMVLDYLTTASPAEAESASGILALAALDADANARERALGLLERQKNPRLPDFARAQLRDADSQIRLQGLEYLRNAGDQQLLPVLIQAVNDPEPVVAACADSILRKWTGNDFGLRMRDTVITDSIESNAQMESGKLAMLRNATAGWNAWWQTNQGKFTALPPVSISFPAREDQPIAGDFALKNLDGRTVHLSDFKGRTVLLNFWTTWCAACQEEIPRLVALQKNHPDDLVILAVSLDGASVEDADEIEAQAGTSDDPLAATPAQIHEKIARIIKSCGINYPILLDPRGKISARFNGHELPTNVFIDSAGVVRRRFIGTRSLATLEAMFRDAESP